MGPDHLLRVSSTRFSEQYRRFYFRDIQAICLQSGFGPNWTKHGMTAFALLLFVAGLYWSDHKVWGTLLLIAVITYALVVWRRPDCEVSIQTAVSTDRLPSLCRSGPTRKALAAINEKIYASQPQVSADELTAMIAAPPPLPGRTAAGSPPPLPAAAAVAPAPSRLFVWSFGALLLLGALKLAEALLHAPALTWTLPWVYVGTLALLVSALMRAGIRDLRRSAIAAVFTALALTSTLGAASVRWVVARTFVTMRNPQLERVYGGIAENVSLHVVLSIILLGIGCWGLFALLAEWAPGDSVDGPITLFGADRP